MVVMIVSIEARIQAIWSQTHVNPGEGDGMGPRKHVQKYIDIALVLTKC